MSFPIMPFMKKVATPPIMSFQTDKNGTFDPSFTIALGTLKWVIDGERFETNSPSKALTGSTVDSEVFANDVNEGESISTNMASQNIIGELNFEYFTITGSLIVNSNPGLTQLTLSSFSNATTLVRAYSCNLSSLDFSNAILSGSFQIYSNTNLTNLTFSASGNSAAIFDVHSCNLSALDLSGFTSISLSCNASSNNALTSFTQPTSLSSIGAFSMSNCNITGTLNITNFNMTSLLLSNNNNLTAVTFNANAKTFNGVLDLDNCNLSSIDLSAITTYSRLKLNDNINLSSFTLPAGYATVMNTYNVSNCALGTTIINSIFSTLNTFFSLNAPVNNLIVDAGGGTNGSPTGGASNADLVNLRDVVYPNAGFTFTEGIN